MLRGPAEQLALEGLGDGPEDEKKCFELCAESTKCRAATMSRTTPHCPKGKQAQVLLQQLLALSTITTKVSTPPEVKPNENQLKNILPNLINIKDKFPADQLKNFFGQFYKDISGRRLQQ